MVMKHARGRLCEHALVGADFVATCLEPLHRPEPQSDSECFCIVYLLVRCFKL